MGGDQRVSRLDAMFANALGPLSLSTLSKDPPASGVQLVWLGLRLDDDDDNDDGLLFPKDPDWPDPGEAAVTEDSGRQGEVADVCGIV
jgi:hypothetical protein